MSKLSRSRVVAVGLAGVLVAVAAAGAWAGLGRRASADASPPVIAPATPPPEATSPMKDASAAGVTVMALVARPSGDEACTADGAWCVSLGPPPADNSGRRPIVRRAGAPEAEIGSTGADEAASEETSAVWPRLVALTDGGFLAGVETRLSTSYSGGGGSATELRLFRVSPDGPSAAQAPVLSLPVQASLLIRACFGEADGAKRLDACHDEYGFTGRVEVETGGAGPPVILYKTEAWAFPRGASREADSTTRDPLTPADLVRQRDDVCSFSRRFTFDARTDRYEPDRPLPDCSAWTVP